ncbi:MAG TPA: plastocyanin/azurin family copper-binding protein [Candidatus Acidoferrales bacterium]|nr:plastocyanin/azurin family copper-binding protein [Candidatus Acidoferrales bacterium]
MRLTDEAPQKTSILAAVVSILLALAAGAGAVEPATVKGTVSVQPAGTAALQDVVVYVDGTIADATPPAQHATVDQKDQQFVPHVVPVMAGTTVDFLNSDDVLHNAFSNSVAKKFDVGMFPRGESRSVVFDKAGVVDMRCNVHPKMRATVVVLDNPFFAVPRTDGSFSIAGLPPGRYKLRTWSESLKPAEKWVNLNAGEVLNVTLQLEK